MKKVSLGLLFAAMLTGCGNEEMPDTYVCVVTVDGEEVLASEYMYKWKCDMHGENLAASLQSEYDKHRSKNDPAVVAAYQCVPAEEFSRREKNDKSQ